MCREEHRSTVTVSFWVPPTATSFFTFTLNRVKLGAGMVVVPNSGYVPSSRNFFSFSSSTFLN